MLLFVSVSVSSGANAAGGEKCEVQCGFDYFGRPQYWMSETDGLDRCDVIDLIDNNAYQNFGCSANTNIFRNNGFECIADNRSCGGSRRMPGDAIARISERYYEAKKENEAKESETADAKTADAETTDVNGRFQGVGDCFVECGIDFADRIQFWLSKSKDKTYCDVVNAFDNDDWTDLACSDDVAVYETIGYHCVTINATAC